MPFFPAIRTPAIRTRNTPLIAACISGNQPLVDLLIAHGADVDKKADYAKVGLPRKHIIKGVAPLIAASATRHTGIVETLLRARADPLKALGGLTPIQLVRTVPQMDKSVAGLSPSRILRAELRQNPICSIISRAFDDAARETGECCVCWEEKELCHILCAKGCKNVVCKECLAALDTRFRVQGSRFEGYSGVGFCKTLKCLICHEEDTVDLDHYFDPATMSEFADASREWSRMTSRFLDTLPGMDISS